LFENLIRNNHLTHFHAQIMLILQAQLKTHPMNYDQPGELLGEISENKALLLYFYSDRCAPCISLRPKVEQLVHESFPEMKLIFVDSEKFQETTAHFQVFANPALLIFFEGKEYYRLSKYVSTSQLEEIISRPYEMAFD